MRSTLHIHPTAQLHPLGSRSAVHFCLSYLPRSFPLKSLILWAQKLSQGRVSAPRLLSCCEQGKHLHTSTETSCQHPDLMTSLDIRHLCLSYIHRKYPQSPRIDAPSASPHRPQSIAKQRHVQWGTGVGAVRREHRKLSEPGDVAPVNLLRLKHEWLS